MKMDAGCGTLLTGCCPKFTFSTFTPNPNLHKIPDLHGTQIYTNPFSHIDSKKPKFTQPNFTQNPNLHKTFSSNFAQTI